MTPAVELVDFATRYKLRTGKLPAAIPATQDEVRMLNTPATDGDPAAPVPQFMGIDLYPCNDATERRESLQ
ncbi:MAG: hypothetical protein ACREKL_01690 [Chthoniobacterales bacterium]